MIGSWESAWDEFVPFLEFPAELRKVVYTTNAIESLNARFRRAVRHRGHFPNEQAAMKVLYLVATQRRPNRQDLTGRINGWKTHPEHPDRPLRRPHHSRRLLMTITTTYTKNLTDPGPDRTWGYDDLDRLTDQDATPTWAYDDADNLTETSAGEVQVFDDANQLCSTAPTPGTCTTPASGATVFDYDARGNRVEADPASGPTVNYGYDQADRLTQHDDGTTTWTYTYRSDGLRASADDGVDTTGFTWDQTGGLAMLLTETTGTDRTHYLYGPGGLPYAEIAPGGAVTYLHHDQLGSTRLQTNTSAAVTGTVTYDAYGTPTASTGTLSRLGFAGQYTDPTGLQYLRARHYDPVTGQFLTRDPLASITGQPYGYANVSPLAWIDPLGLAPAPPTTRGGYTGVELPEDEGRLGGGCQPPGGIMVGGPYDYSHNDGAPHRPALSQEEMDAVDARSRGEQYNPDAARRGMAKIREAQKNIGARRSSGDDTQRRFDGGDIGGLIAGGGALWWLGKILSPACGPALPACAVIL